MHYISSKGHALSCLYYIAHKTSFATMTANKALSLSSLAVTNDAFRYSGHAHLYIVGNGHKPELKSNRNYLINHTKSKLWTRTCTHINVLTHT